MGQNVDRFAATEARERCRDYGIRATGAIVSAEVDDHSIGTTNLLGDCAKVDVRGFKSLYLH
jgi:hypothetical protein